MSENQYRQSAVVNCSQGLHARPAVSLVEAAMGFECEVKLHKGDQVIDAKSVLQVLTLGATFGTSLEVVATGEQAKEAVSAVVDVIQANDSLVESGGDSLPS